MLDSVVCGLEELDSLGEKREVRLEGGSCDVAEYPLFVGISVGNAN
jgi:hypothetical protein